MPSIAFNKALLNNNIYSKYLSFVVILQLAYILVHYYSTTNTKKVINKDMTLVAYFYIMFIFILKI